MVADAIARGGPVTRRGVAADLAALGVERGGVVLVHSSLSRLGWVAGGAQAVALALIDALGPSGTILVPAFTPDWSDPAGWSAPPVPEQWWSVIRAERPGFDPLLTPSQGMGRIADCIRQLPGARRSVHPLCSFAAVGPASEALVGAHQLSPSLGEGSPLARLYELDGAVLLLGVGHANNTSLHLAEVRARRLGDRLERSRLRQGDADVAVEIDDLDYDASDFPLVGAAFCATGAERTGPVGAGSASLMAQRELVDFASGWFGANRAPL